MASLAFLLSAGHPASAAQLYAATPVTDPLNFDVWGLFVNPAGQVTGNRDNDGDAFMWGTFYSAGVGGASGFDLCGAVVECSSQFTGVNGSDEISGSAMSGGGGDSETYPGDATAFRYDYLTGAVTHLQPETQAFAVNAQGQLIGVYVDSHERYRAFIWNGALKDLGTLGGAESLAYASSAAGQAVGCSQTPSGAWHPFRYANGVMHDLGLPAGLVNACAYSINATGAIVGGELPGPFGYYVGQGSCRAWIRTSGGSYSFLPKPSGATCLEARHIDLNSQVVGTAIGGTTLYAPFLYSAGTTRLIRASALPFDQGYVVYAGFGNNLHGQLAVNATDTVNGIGDQDTVGLLLTPISVRDENATSLSYSGSWSRVAQSGSYNGSVKKATANGASVQTSFTGKTVAIIGPKGPSLPTFDVYLDGKFVTTASEQSTSNAVRQRVFTHTWSTSGSHTLRLIGRSGFALDAITTSTS